VRVFNTESVGQSPTWTRSTVPAPILPEGSGPGRLLRAGRNALRLLREATADDVVVFTDEHPVSGNLFGLLQRLRRSRPTLVRTDPLLHLPRTALRKNYLQAALAAVDRLIVWAPAVAERYHRCFGVPREKMVPLRFHHTLTGFEVPAPTCGDYVFSGGNSMRDYPTLLEAVRGLPVPVRVATSWQPPAALTVPDNVVLAPSTEPEFRALLAGARLVVFPLRLDGLRTSGQQSYLNAMALAKAVVVTDTVDAPFYIGQHRTGVLVPSGDAAALREAILHLLDSPAVAGALGEAARATAAALDQEYTWSNVLALAREAHRQRAAPFGPRALGK
jgi:glycosyltransferase involved in cell wall biosynthesis